MALHFALSLCALEQRSMVTRVSVCLSVCVCVTISLLQTHTMADGLRRWFRTHRHSRHTNSTEKNTINYHENIIFTYEMHGIGIEMAEMASENARIRFCYTPFCTFYMSACLPACCRTLRFICINDNAALCRFIRMPRFGSCVCRSPCMRVANT